MTKLSRSQLYVHTYNQHFAAAPWIKCVVCFWFINSFGGTDVNTFF